MKLHFDPPIDEWCSLAVLPAGGSADKRSPRPRPRIATGHQPWFWHPGILAKYMAANAFAKSVNGDAIDIVVDQDTRDAISLDVPIVRDGLIEAKQVVLAELSSDVPLGMQPPLSVDTVLSKLNEVARMTDARHVGSFEPLFNGWRKAASESFDSLADQIRCVLGEQFAASGISFNKTLNASTFLDDSTGKEIVAAMLSDARGCVAAYNDAVTAVPSAGIAKLIVEPDRVELPLWHLVFGQPRRKVFADLSDSSPCLTLDDGSELAADWHSSDDFSLAPRALLLTALMRSAHCDLFLHGTGGGIYDAITEQWWQIWRGRSLAPIAVVSADIHLEFVGVPVADKHDHERAVWFAHHLPHNLDRYLPVTDAVASAREHKQAVLERMQASTDRHTRSECFNELHALNATLAADHEEIVQLSQDQVGRTRAGIRNRGMVRRRDWSFALYPPETLRAMSDAINDCVNQR